MPLESARSRTVVLPAPREPVSKTPQPLRTSPAACKFTPPSSTAKGGLLRDLAALPGAVELTAVRRFQQPWEADASLQLRARKPEIADTYQREGRIAESSTDTV